MSALTEEEQLAYQADGFVIRRNQFAQSLMARVNRALDIAEKELLAAAALMEKRMPWMVGPSLISATEPCNLNLAKHGQRQAIAGSRAHRRLHATPRLAGQDASNDRANSIDPVVRSIVAVDDKLNFKAAGGTGFEWHQDAPYWTPVSDSVADMPNVMVALIRLRSLGCLRGIRGSHLGGAYPGKQDGSPLAGFYTDPACFDLTAAVNFEVNAGDLIFLILLGPWLDG